jgi:ribosomal-protein-alanine N-acetyltransferase
MKNIQIDTSRLTIREFEYGDFEAVHSYASNPSVVRYLCWGPNNEADTRNFLNRVIKNQGSGPRYEYELAVILKTENKLIGGCATHVTKNNVKEAALGYCLNQDYWNRGYASEVTKALIEFGFKELNLHRIFAICDPGNIGSYRVMEHNGMVKEGRLREHMWQRGTWRDSLIYSILEKEFRIACVSKEQ